MFKHALSSEVNSPDFTLTFLCMVYVTMVVLSIVLFDQIVKFNFWGINVSLSGSVIPYVFLYPISFIVLRVYGFKYVNHMIGSMILVCLIFVIMSKLVAAMSSNSTVAMHNILIDPFKMYLAGFVGMPAGIYTSFLTINLLNKLGFAFNAMAVSIATMVGEIINTLIVFPIGLHDQYELHVIFTSIILDTLIFKFIMGIILALLTVVTINLIVSNKLHNV